MGIKLAGKLLSIIGAIGELLCFTRFVVWNIFYFSIQLGMSSSQLTNSNLFQRGMAKNHQPEDINHIQILSIDYP